MLDFKVSNENCTRCGACANECPTRIIRQEGNEFPAIAADDEANCMRCQHCLAICPTAAISILGKDPADSLPLDAAQLPTLDATERLVRGNRSVRNFREEDVDSELIDRLLAAAANAPAGANRRDLTFSVIDTREALVKLRAKVLEALRDAMEAGKIPEEMAYLQMAVPAFFNYGADVIFRGAPHILIVSAGPEALCPNEDVTIALSTFDLLATSAGLGTVWCGMLRMAFETLPELKQLVDLPPDAHYYAMLFGTPDVHYARTVQRDDSATIRHL